MTNNNGLEDRTAKHFQPLLNWSKARLDARFPVPAVDWFSRLERILFPYEKPNYPGRIVGFARLLGVSASYALRLSKPSGTPHLSLPIVSKAEKICADLISELTVIKEGLELERKRLEARPKRTGMFKVQVRDASGIPKTGLWRDGWRRK